MRTLAPEKRFLGLSVASIHHRTNTGRARYTNIERKVIVIGKKGIIKNYKENELKIKCI